MRRVKSCLGILQNDGHDLRKDGVLLMLIEAVCYWIWSRDALYPTSSFQSIAVLIVSLENTGE